MRLVLELLMLAFVFAFILAIAVADITIYRIIYYNKGNVGTYLLRAYMFFFFGLGNSLILFSVLIYINSFFEYSRYKSES